MESQRSATIFEINDPELDPDAIMATIRTRIEQRRAELGYEGRTFPNFGAAAYAGEPKDLAYDADLHHYLRMVNENYANAETEALLVSSPATRIPVLGRIWQLIRGGAHGLVLFYVNRAVTHQTEINRQLVSVLNRMTVAMETQQRTIIGLQADLDALRHNREEK